MEMEKEIKNRNVFLTVRVSARVRLVIAAELKHPLSLLSKHQLISEIKFAAGRAGKQKRGVGEAA